MAKVSLQETRDKIEELQRLCDTASKNLQNTTPDAEMLRNTAKVVVAMTSLSGQLIVAVRSLDDRLQKLEDEFGGKKIQY